MPDERPGTASSRGTPLTLLGRQLGPGETAPDFELVGASPTVAQLAAGEIPPVRLSDLRGRVVLLSCVPSLNTRVCSVETRRWEQEREQLGDQVEVLTVSMDLPFAQALWCEAEGVRHRTASAHMHEEFAIDYGVLVKELRLLARAVFLIGKDGWIRHVEYVREFMDEPDYAALIEAARRAVDE